MLSSSSLYLFHQRCQFIVYPLRLIMFKNISLDFPTDVELHVNISPIRRTFRAVITLLSLR